MTASISVQSKYNSKRITDSLKEVLHGVCLPKCKMSFYLTVKKSIGSFVLTILMPLASYTLLPKH